MQIEFNLYPSQQKAWDALFDRNITQVLLGGSANSGKSYFGCYWLIYLAITYPGTRYLLGRSRLTELKKGTLVTFFRCLNDLKITNEHYTYNQVDNTITFNWNKSVIVLMDLAYAPSDPEYSRLGSLEFSAGYIDECNLIEAKAKNIVLSRIRWKLKEFNITPHLLLTCNPNKEWCYTEFYEANKLGVLPSNKAFINSHISENSDNTSQEYISMLLSLDSNSKKRLYDADWEYDEDGTSLVKYHNITNMFCKTPKEELPTSDDYYLSIDVATGAGRDSTVIFVWNGMNVIEILKYDSTIDRTFSTVKQLIEKYNIPFKNIIIDSDGVGVGLTHFLRGSVKFLNNSKALNKENYQNLKTQCYFELANRINNGELSIHNCTEEIQRLLTQELAVIKQTAIDLEQKIQITSKEEIKSAIGRSPDFSDAMMFRAYFWAKNKFITGRYYAKNLSSSKNNFFNGLNKTPTSFVGR